MKTALVSFTEMSVIMQVSLFPLDFYLQSVMESLMETVCGFTVNGESLCLLGSWTPAVDDRNGETFLQAEFCGWKTT